MNKFKKVGIIAVSVVMSTTMVFSLAACGGNNDDDDDGELTMEYTSDTQIGIAIGYNSASTGAFYATTGDTGIIAGEITLPGNYTASSGSLKPAMYAIQEALDVKFVDGYTGNSTSVNIDSSSEKSIVATGAWGDTVDVATSDLSVAVSEAATNNNILNLGDYLDYMPNFKAFLEENPVVYLSLLQDGMSTTDGSGKEIYVAPYFDGNDDIERYCLIRQDWVKELLDAETLTNDGDTVAAACGITTTSVESYMGTSGSYTVETSTEADKGATTFTLKKDYTAAKTAVTTSGTALYNAYTAITGGTAYSGTSGNIVDIMNAAINAKNGDVSGKKLVALYTAYIDVAYINADTNESAYGETRSNLFNGYSAAWDVDDLVAMLRIVKTNSQNLGLASCSTVGIFPRDSSNDRTPDIVRLAAQLYGERGADSRFEYTYIDAYGNLQDARQNESFWDCLVRFGTLADEGLVDNYWNNASYDKGYSSTAYKGSSSADGTGFMMYDYSQTQTAQMFNTCRDSNTSHDYLFAAVNTPVSMWDVDGDGTKEEVMRFTESWRSTKTGGLVVAANVKKDKNKLAAVLTFIDYLYSNDGQILATYGMQDTTENSSSPNGTWYGKEVSSYTDTGSGITVDGKTVATEVGGQYVVTSEYESRYFCFNNKLYEGTLYKGAMTPIVTTELYNSFISKDSNDIIYSTFKQGQSFTGYARAVLGATLPMGVKDQSFENQLTATAAADEATKVSASLSNGTIKHVNLSIDSTNYWYTTVPTSLPLSSAQNAALTSNEQAQLRGMSGTNMKDNKGFFSLFQHVIWEGYSGSYNQQGYTFDFGNISDAKSLITSLNNKYYLTSRVAAMQSGWSVAKNYWTYLSAEIG